MTTENNQPPFSEASMDFTSDNAKVILSDSDSWAFRYDDFTIESWVNCSDLSETGDYLNDKTIFGTMTPGVNKQQFLFYIRYNGELGFWNGNFSVGGGKLENNTWHHVALVRKNLRMYMYLDGQLVYTGCNSVDYRQTNGFSIGAVNDPYLNGGSAWSRYFKGHMQDFRITNGQAVYTSNFVLAKSLLNKCSKDDRCPEDCILYVKHTYRTRFNSSSVTNSYLIQDGIPVSYSNGSAFDNYAQHTNYSDGKFTVTLLTTKDSNGYAYNVSISTSPNGPWQSNVLVPNSRVLHSRIGAYYPITYELILPPIVGDCDLTELTPTPIPQSTPTPTETCNPTELQFVMTSNLQNTLSNRNATTEDDDLTIDAVAYSLAIENIESGEDLHATEIPVTFSSSDENIVSVVDNGTKLSTTGVGTATITANVVGNCTYLSDVETQVQNGYPDYTGKTFTVTVSLASTPTPTETETPAETLSWAQSGECIDGEADADLSGYSTSLNSDGTIVAIGARNNQASGYHAGHVRVYQNISGTWTQIGDDFDGDAGDLKGTSVSLNSSGTIVAIGATLAGEPGRPGQVCVYQLPQQTPTPTPTETCNPTEGQVILTSNNSSTLFNWPDAVIGGEVLQGVEQHGIVANQTYNSWDPGCRSTGNNGPTGIQIIYSSSDENIVSVIDNGTKLSAVGAGTATITATAPGDCTYYPAEGEGGDGSGGQKTFTVTVSLAPTPSPPGLYGNLWAIGKNTNDAFRSDEQDTFISSNPYQVEKIGGGDIVQVCTTPGSYYVLRSNGDLYVMGDRPDQGWADYYFPDFDCQEDGSCRGTMYQIADNIEFIETSPSQPILFFKKISDPVLYAYGPNAALKAQLGVGQLGTTTTTLSGIHRVLDGDFEPLENIVQVSVGHNTTVFRTSDGAVYGAGDKIALGVLPNHHSYYNQVYRCARLLREANPLTKKIATTNNGGVSILQTDGKLFYSGHITDHAWSSFPDTSDSHQHGFYNILNDVSDVYETQKGCLVKKNDGLVYATGLNSFPLSGEWDAFSQVQDSNGDPIEDVHMAQQCIIDSTSFPSDEQWDTHFTFLLKTDGTIYSMHKNTFEQINHPNKVNNLAVGFYSWMFTEGELN